MPKIIAEIGVNHMGDVQEALKLIRGSAEAGAWGVKFQLYIPDLLDARKERQELLKKCMLTKRELLRCRHLAYKLGLRFGASCFDNPSVELLRCLAPDFQKTACGQGWPGMKRLSCMQFQSYTYTMAPSKDTIALLCVPKYPAMLRDYLPIPGWADGISDHCYHGSGSALSRGLAWAEVHVGRLQGIPDDEVSCPIDALGTYISEANTIGASFPVQRTRVVLKRPIKGQKVAWLRGV